MSQENENQEAVEYIESNGSFLERVPSWLISMVIHTVLLIVMMFVQVDQQQKKAAVIFTASADEEIVEEEIMEEEEEEELEMDLEVEDMEEVETEVTVDTPTDVPVEVEVANDTMDDEPPPAVVEFTPLATTNAVTSDNNASINSYTSGTGLADRRRADSAALSNGGSRASQNAVKLGLEWIARHQLPNGSWNYNHCLAAPGQCTCGNPGSMTQCTNGATAMGILPFLGCGMTHREGTYQKQIGAGLKFLVASMKKDPKCPGGGSLHQSQGTMYAHGLATICLTEAYAMTKEKSLRVPAQAAVNFVMYAQDPVGGGWRYSPRQAGDTSVVGWQLMALKSGYMGYLQVNPQCTAKAMNFLNTVQKDNGATYGYTTPGNGPACTAIGLLCRMYYGWKQDNPALRKGVEYLGKMGPSADMYYNYYATQVMRHFGGDQWTKWNEKMREQLVKGQVKEESHAKGSWNPAGGHSDSGGRLYATALSIMTLEVYYRHQPIYQSQTMDKPAALE